MAKKSKKINVSSVINATVALLALVSVLLIFSPSIVWGDSAFRGWDVTFGYADSLPEGVGEIIGTVFTGEVFLFSPANLLPYILALIALFGALLAIFSKCRWISLIVAIASIASGVLFLFVKDFTYLSELLAKIFELLGTPFASNEYVSLGGGVIASSTLMFISGLLSLASFASRS